MLLIKICRSKQELEAAREAVQPIQYLLQRPDAAKSAEIMAIEKNIDSRQSFYKVGLMACG